VQRKKCAFSLFWKTSSYFILIIRFSRLWFVLFKCLFHHSPQTLMVLKWKYKWAEERGGGVPLLNTFPPHLYHWLYSLECSRAHQVQGNLRYSTAQMDWTLRWHTDTGPLVYRSCRPGCHVLVVYLTESSTWETSTYSLLLKVIKDLVDKLQYIMFSFVLNHKCKW